MLEITKIMKNTKITKIMKIEFGDIEFGDIEFGDIEFGTVALQWRYSGLQWGYSGPTRRTAVTSSPGFFSV